jgi:hypothetical protein
VAAQQVERMHLIAGHVVRLHADDEDKVKLVDVTH